MTSSYNFLEDLLGRTSYKIAMTILRHLSNPYRNSKDGNLILTALAIGRVPCNKKSRICTRPSSFDTHLGEWASAYFQPWNSQGRFVEVSYAQIIQFLFVPGFVVHLRCNQLILICHRGSWPRLVDIVEDGMTMIINSSLN